MEGFLAVSVASPFQISSTSVSNNDPNIAFNSGYTLYLDGDQVPNGLISYGSFSGSYRQLLECNWQHQYIYYLERDCESCEWSGFGLQFIGFDEEINNTILHELINKGKISFNTTDHLWSFDLSDYKKETYAGSLVHSFESPIDGSLTLLNTGDLYAEDKPEFKVCADGTTTSLFSIFLEPDQNIDARDLKWMLRIKNAPEDRDFGTYGILEKDLQASNDQAISFLYTHPEYFSKDIHDPLIIEIFDTENQAVIDQFNLNVFLPPVLMVHGLWGDNTSFTVMKDKLLDSDGYTNNHLLRADYRSTNDREFSVNQGVVPKHLDFLFNRLIRDGIATSKANIVAHSMGGILARLYIQSSEYKGDILKLFTINTPHSGSQVADLLFDADIQNEIPDETICNRIIDKYVAKKQGACYGGAVFDLQVEGEAITNLNSNQSSGKGIFYYTMTSTAEPYKAMSWFLPFEWNDIFNGNPHDLIVELASQRAGLTAPATYETEETHTEAQKNEEAIRVIEGFLEFLLTFSDRVFSDELNPPQLQYIRPTTANQEFDEGIVSAFNIASPQENEIYKIGDWVSIEIETKQPLEEFGVSWGALGANNIFSKSPTIVSASSFQKDIQIDERQLGRYSIVAISRVEVNGKQKIALDERTILVTTDKKPSLIEITAPNPNFDSIAVDQHYEVSVEAKIEGKTYFIQEAPEIEYIFDKGLAEYIGEGKIKGLQTGTDTLKVIFNGIESEPIAINIIEKDSTISTSIKESTVSGQGKLHLFPSPARDQLNILLISENSKVKNMSMYDQIGRRVLVKNNFFTNQISPLDISNLQKGIYFINIITDQKIYSEKFIKL